ncbi:MAG: hypothetical protein KAW12_30290 [Candidatus Aminicenantes bacterium]|nr:hypothetical protein [Candidatus Aminicenantes bacterium]
MKKITIFVAVILMASLTQAKKLADLPEVEKPFSIVVDKGQLFVSDHTVTLHIYSMKDFKYTKQVSQKGEGPGEFRHTPFFAVYPDDFFVYTGGKCMYFSRKGDYKKEFKINSMGVKMISPLGKNFVVNRRGVNQKTGYHFSKFILYTYTEEKGIEYKGLLYYIEPRKVTNRKKPDYPVISPWFYFIVHEDKVFIGDPSRGLFVQVFDSEGSEIGTIQNLEVPRRKITAQYKKKHMDKMKKSRHFNTVNNMYNIVFPEYFPDFYRFGVNNGKIYFLTYNQKDDLREIYITDFTGKMLKKTYVPFVENDVHMHFSIVDDKFYYIMENEETEMWELHMVEIK